MLVSKFEVAMDALEFLSFVVNVTLVDLVLPYMSEHLLSLIKYSFSKFDIIFFVLPKWTKKRKTNST